MKLLIRMFWMTMVLLLVAVFSNVALAEECEYMLRNGRVYTVNEAQPYAQSVGVKGDKIVYVGSDEGAKPYIGSKTKILDLKGRMVLPGFIETHFHPILGSALASGVHLDDDMSKEQILSAVKEYAAKNPDLDVIAGFGFGAIKFGETGPLKEDLDRIISDKPVVLIDSGGHSAWANSKALEIAGIDKNTPDPMPGVHYFKRDKDGNPTGFLLEAQAFAPVMVRTKAVKKENMLKGLETLLPVFSSMGITAGYDAGFFADFEGVGYEVLEELYVQKKLPFRLVTSHMIQKVDQIPQAVNRLSEYNRKFNDDYVRASVMKIHNDGTVEALTAAMLEDYPIAPGQKGEVLIKEDALKKFVIEIDKAGLDIHIHALGDRTVHEALNAFEAARKANPGRRGRFSIAHAQFFQDSDIKRFKELDVTITTTPAWMHFSPAVDGMMGESLRAKSMRYRSVLSDGGKVAFGSDWPASEGGLENVRPLLNIEMGHTRQKPGKSSSVVMPPIEERIDLASMIKGYTISAAYMINMEKKIGSIEVGKYADLVVLDKNIFVVPADTIHEIAVVMTMMGGKVTYESK